MVQKERMSNLKTHFIANFYFSERIIKFRFETDFDENLIILVVDL